MLAVTLQDVDPKPTDESKWSADITSTGGTFTTGPLGDDLAGDWSPILKHFGLDPDIFTVVDDTVRMSKWQQSKRLDNGDRDIIWLYAYSGRFARRTQAEELADKDLESARKHLARLRHRPTTGKRSGPPVTYVHHQGDEQAGKGEGSGLDGLLLREQRVMERSLDRLKALIKAGVNVEAVCDNSAGDRVENIFGHYPSQARTTATLRKQIAFAVDMDVARTKAFAEFDLPITKVYTPSNHGEIRQSIGGGSYTSASDNYDLIIAEYAQRVLGEAFGEQISWHIPHDQWVTIFHLSGIPVGATHGHKADKRNLKAWIKEQRDYWHFHHAHRMQIMLMGHRHHAYIEDVGGTTVILTPSIDGGSPYFEATFGERATHGALSFLVGDINPFGWDQLAIL